jgi:hydroxymethylglutaryl-CoA lyase
MAKDELTGNMPTEKIISYIKQENFDHKINNDQLLSALRKASEIFSSYH